MADDQAVQKGTPALPYSAPSLAVLACVYLLTNDTGRGADMDDVTGLLRERYGMTEAEAAAAVKTAQDEGAIGGGGDE